MKPGKYKAKPVVIDGIRFPSQKEAARWQQLRLLELAGEIRNLQRQVVIPLQGQRGPILTETGKIMRLTIDFAYEDKRVGWSKVFEESKGMRTRDYDVRLAVVQAMGIKVIHT